MDEPSPRHLPSVAKAASLCRAPPPSTPARTQRSRRSPRSTPQTDRPSLSAFQRLRPRAPPPVQARDYPSQPVSGRRWPPPPACSAPPALRDPGRLACRTVWKTSDSASWFSLPLYLGLLPQGLLVSTLFLGSLRAG